jgi:hypothetical protein
MTPKEKAEELVDQFYNETKVLHQYFWYCWEAAQKCALIAVDLLMEQAYRQNDYEGFISYWKEVKQEINKL